MRAQPRSNQHNRLAWALALAVLLLALVRPTSSACDLSYLEDSSTDAQAGISSARPSLEVWRETAMGPRKIRADEALGRGDRVQVVVRRPLGPWVTLSGLDGAGVVEVYGSWKIDLQRPWQPAPFALTLDGTPGAQHFIAIFTEDRITEHRVASMMQGEVGVEGQLASVVVEKRR